METPAAPTTNAQSPSATVTEREGGRLKKRVRETLRAAGEGGGGREINVRAVGGTQQSKRRRIARPEPEASGGVGSGGASKQTHIRDHFRAQPPLVAATTKNGADLLSTEAAAAAAAAAGGVGDSAGGGSAAARAGDARRVSAVESGK